MKINEVMDLQTKFHKMEAAIKNCALEKIKARDRKANRGRESSFIRYLHLEEFYVEDGLIYVRFGFLEPSPYAGSEEVELTQEDLEGIA